MYHLAACILLFALPSSALVAQPATHDPPPRADEPSQLEEPKVLLPAPIANGASRESGAIEVAAHERAADIPSSSASAGASSPPQDDQSEVPHRTAPSEEGRLLRRSRASEAPHERAGPNPGQNDSPLALLSSDSATTALAATALVVGLFLVCAWAFKKSMPKSARIVPNEAVEILGRCPLGNKQFAQLLHVGNKVILVNVTPNGAETLVEVDDPGEVTRILGVCASAGPGSSSKEFDAIFQQFAKDPAPRGFLGEESVGSSARSSTYSEPPRGGRHA